MLHFNIIFFLARSKRQRYINKGLGKHTHLYTAEFLVEIADGIKTSPTLTIAFLEIDSKETIKNVSKVLS